MSHGSVVTTCGMGVGIFSHDGVIVCNCQDSLE